MLLFHTYLKKWSISNQILSLREFWNWSTFCPLNRRCRDVPTSCPCERRWLLRLCKGRANQHKDSPLLLIPPWIFCCKFCMSTKIFQRDKCLNPKIRTLYLLLVTIFAFDDCLGTWECLWTGRRQEGFFPNPVETKLGFPDGPTHKKKEATWLASLCPAEDPARIQGEREVGRVEVEPYYSDVLSTKKHLGVGPSLEIPSLVRYQSCWGAILNRAHLRPFEKSMLVNMSHLWLFMSPLGRFQRAGLHRWFKSLVFRSGHWMMKIASNNVDICSEINP